MTVITVQLEGFDGPTVHRAVDTALDELKDLLTTELEAGPGATIIIRTREMSEAELESLPEFPGY